MKSSIRSVFLLLLALLAGCASGPHIDKSYSAMSQDSRVRFLVLHYTAGPFPGSLNILTKGAVSSHYLVDDTSARIYGLVDEERRSFHAGVSYWRGFTNLNYNSIGIEIVNVGFTESAQGRVYVPYDVKQMDAVVELAETIIKRHKIAPENVVGHSDIAPQRKTDPGPLFPWKRLADKGLIAWPDAQEVEIRTVQFAFSPPEVLWVQKKLLQVGYLVPQTGVMDTDTTNVIAAFQMKYRPAQFDGSIDAETAAMLDVLTSPAARPPSPAAAVGCSQCPMMQPTMPPTMQPK